MRARGLSPVAAALVAALAASGLAGCKATASLPETFDLASQNADIARMPVDLLEGDLTQPAGDLAVSTDGPPPDLATAGDLAKPVDMGIPDAPPPADLAGPKPDLATPDLARPVDLAGADLACAMACNAPPAATCMANNVVTYAQNGTCVNGACSYAPMSMACTNGCYKAACTAALSFLGNTAAFQTGTGNQVGLFNGTAPSGNSVSAISQTFPHGAAKAVHLIYGLNDPMFKNPVDVVMMPDPNAPMGNNDQWYAIIPKQAPGTKVTWYLRADPYSGNAIYDSGGGQNFSYTSQ